MLKKIKYGKISAVVFLTVLIWVWADLALDERLDVFNLSISVAKSGNAALWINFNKESSVSIDKIVLKGPALKIADVRRKLRDGSFVREFVLIPEEQSMTAPGRYPFDVLNFLRQNDRIKQFGLTVHSCEPETLSVDVESLDKKKLAVQCVDEDGNPVSAIIEP